MNEFTVPQSHVGLLYEDGAFVRTLKAGRHKLVRGYFDRVDREVRTIDLRERSLTIKGQEILTKDKVAIRVSLLVYYRVKNAEAAAHNVASYEERIYEDVQLAARRYLASRSLDAILSDRNEISDTVRDEVTEAAAGYGVEILRADVKDLIFPGNLREIMNQVLETERRAEAKMIEARRAADTLKIQSEAGKDAELRQIEIERERRRLDAESERERLAVRLEAEIREAEALREHPELLQVRQIEALAAMAKSGARFVIGLDGKKLGLMLDDE